LKYLKETFFLLLPLTGHLAYPFQNEKGNCHRENLLFSYLTLKEQRKGKLKAIIDPHFLERISQAGCLCEAEKRMKVYFSYIILYFGRLSKEVASTGRRSSPERGRPAAKSTARLPGPPSTTRYHPHFLHRKRATTPPI
jgi:hypothetical protein